MSAVAYIKITAEEVASGYPSLAIQEQKIRDFATLHNIRVSKVFFDDSIGILHTAPHKGPRCSRSGIASIIKAASSSPWSIILTFDKSRFQRTDVGLDLSKEMESIGKAVIAIDQEMSNRDECFLLAASRRVKPKEPKRPRIKSHAPLVERLYIGRVERAAAGFHQSGPIPFGYRRVSAGRGRDRNRKALVLDEKESALVNTIFKEYLRKKSLKKLIKFLSERGLKTRRGREWSRAGLSWILKNETYLGKVHFGKVRTGGKHPAIVSSIIFNKVQKLLARNNKRGVKNGCK